MSQVTFEELRDKDLASVTDLYNHYVIHSTATFSLSPLSLDDMRHEVYFENPRHRTFVIRQLTDDNIPVDNICGYVLIAPFKGRCAYNDSAEVTIYLDPASLGVGIGRQAAAYIENYAREQKIHTLISIICADNMASIILFQKSGYQQCAHYKEVGKKFDRLLDVVCYQKIL